MKRFLVCLILIQMLFISNVNAKIVCNDNTISNSCNDCHRGCCSHHGGCSTKSSSSSNNYSNSSNSLNSSSKPVVKSNDVSLKEVTIDSEKLDINDMSYSTNKERVNVYVVANDSKATVEYDKELVLDIGGNTEEIKVTAENGNVKSYMLNITREKVLSGNNNIDIIVDGEKVVFDSLKSSSIDLSSDKDKLDIDYKLEDENAKVKIIGNNNLKAGENEVVVNVKAENGDEQDYILIVDKASKGEDYIVGIGSIALCLFLGFYFKGRSKKNI